MSDSVKVLVIEADENLLQALISRFENEGFKPQPARNRVQAGALLRSLRFDAILSEVRLPDGDCERIYRDALPFIGSTPIMFTSASGDIDQAVRLAKSGADYVLKPYDISVVVERLRSIIERQRPERPCVQEPILVSAAMRDLGARIEKLAAMSINVLVTGESGSGKDVVVRQIHRLSRRANKPFAEVACASLACADGERILFGEINGSLDGPLLRAGALEQAGEGTLFLDEVDEMPSALQSRLVQAIDEGQFRRVGEAAGSASFRARILAGSQIPGVSLRTVLRPALFHRLAVVELEVPPLRDRQADIEPLTRALLRSVASDLGSPVPRIDAAAMAAMHDFDWPGNVRELRNRLIRAVSFASGETIRVEDLFPDRRPDRAAGRRKETLEEVRSMAERERIAEALSRCDGRISDTAHSLGISRVTLWSKMKRLGLPSIAAHRVGANLIDRKSGLMT